MTDRFEVIFRLPENLYAQNAPIIILAAVLLKDTVTNTVVAQLKYRNISGKTIKALKVGLTATDIAGQSLQGVDDYQYLDIEVPENQDFGSNKAIVMPSAFTRSFSIKNITVVFLDDTKWTLSSDLLPLPEKTLLVDKFNSELVYQYQITVTPQAEYVPIESSGLWLCTCGTWNCSSECGKCGSERENIFSSFNADKLSEEMYSRLFEEDEEKQRVENENKIKAEKLAAKHRQQSKRIKVASIVILPIIVILIIVSCKILPSVIQPRMETRRFNKALEILTGNSSEHTEAEKLNALSLVMMSCLEERLEYANNPPAVLDEEYYRGVLAAEEKLLEIKQLDISNETVRTAFFSYLDGLRKQKVVFNRYIQNTNSNFSKLGREYDWINGADIRASAIITLSKEGLIKLPEEEYGQFCIKHIEGKFYEALSGSVSLTKYDSTRYSITIYLENDTQASFDRVEVLMMWNTTPITVSIENWEVGERWTAKIIVPEYVISSGNATMGINVTYEGIHMHAKNN